MSERRFVLLDFTCMSREGCSRLYEAGRVYTLLSAITHTAKRELVAKQRCRADGGWYCEQGARRRVTRRAHGARAAIPA